MNAKVAKLIRQASKQMAKSEGLSEAQQVWLNEKLKKEYLAMNWIERTQFVQTAKFSLGK